jgi:hypothetical protein
MDIRRRDQDHIPPFPNWNYYGYNEKSRSNPSAGLRDFDGNILITSVARVVKIAGACDLQYRFGFGGEKNKGQKANWKDPLLLRRA